MFKSEKESETSINFKFYNRLQYYNKKLSIQTIKLVHC